MKTLKIFGIFALLLVAGAFVVPALAQQMQSRSQLGDGDGVCDCYGVCDGTCDGVCDKDGDGVPDQIRSRTRDCSCDGSQTRDGLQKGDMTQTRSRLCKVVDQLKTQQRIQLKDQSC